MFHIFAELSPFHAASAADAELSMPPLLSRR